MGVCQVKARPVAERLQLAGDLFSHGNERAERKDGDAVVVAVLEQFGFAHRDRARNVLHRTPGPRPRGQRTAIGPFHCKAVNSMSASSSSSFGTMCTRLGIARR